ncbi:hypothetical protein L210DRAFT_3734756 [Boletus edulis BED1]|uniref:Uncharacterized protein n=1 Tax=Boletus edulis BED1 TaxID=1328754 RepID=A0AAD4G8Q3_BOLED|nr:hypothetical protein L210DRAFT_3734756 [Boletus edulis BED1]
MPLHTSPPPSFSSTNAHTSPQKEPLLTNSSFRYSICAMCSSGLCSPVPVQSCARSSRDKKMCWRAFRQIGRACLSLPHLSAVKLRVNPRHGTLYSLIGILYASLPPERVLQFWGATPVDATRGLSYMEITEMSVGKLPLFLQWATWSMQVRDENMTTALYDMLSGLAKG